MEKFRNFANFFSETGKTTKKEQKETKVFVIFEDFYVIFRHKKIKLATSRIRVVSFGGENSQLVDFSVF
jgi:hypothetical protein